MSYRINCDDALKSNKLLVDFCCKPKKKNVKNEESSSLKKNKGLIIEYVGTCLNSVIFEIRQWGKKKTSFLKVSYRYNQDPNMLQTRRPREQKLKSLLKRKRLNIWVRIFKVKSF